MSSQVRYLQGEDELKNTILIYETYTANIQSSLITKQKMLQKGQKFLQWVNDLLAQKIITLNKIVQRSIIIFKHILKQQIQISAKMVELENSFSEKNTTIQNYLYTIKKFQTKLIDRQESIFKLRQQNEQLTQKIQNQETKFKRQTKELRKTFIQIQQTNESQKEIRDSIQLEYEHQKQQKHIIKGTSFIIYKDQLATIKQERQALKKHLDQYKRLLNASENKIQYQVKRKMPLQQTIRQQKEIIHKLLSQIEDLKDNVRIPYHEDAGHVHIEDKQVQILSHFTDSFQKNNLKDQMALRQSFSQVDISQFSRKNSLRKSFDQKDDNYHADFSSNYYAKINQYHQPFSINRDSNHQSQLTDSPASSFIKVEKTNSQSPKSILMKEITPMAGHSSSESLQNKLEAFMHSPNVQINHHSEKKYRPILHSPKIQNFETSHSMTQKDDQLEIISQKIESDTSTFYHFRKFVPDVYFAHFLLTTQAVKIKQDCQQILNLEVKQYYKQIIDKRIPMHLWSDWIRDKLRSILKQNNEKSKKFKQQIGNNQIRR